MPKPSILILDDDEMWLARHERRLDRAGFRCFATQSATEAIALGKSQTSIKFALIDEILFVPPVPSDIAQAELQRWQGSGVIREITNLRRDIQFIIVTSAPPTSQPRRSPTIYPRNQQTVPPNQRHRYHPQTRHRSRSRIPLAD